MHVIRVRNVNQALPEGLRELINRGQPMPSRGGDVIVHPLPVTTVYSSPTERVMFHPERDANPFFHFFEALWMLAGRRDAAFLNRFVRDFGERYSDYEDQEGRRLIHGAYGWRWRRQRSNDPSTDLGFSYRKFDQLHYIVKYLKRHPFGRRAVLSMWDPSTDLSRVDLMKDVPCLSGETIVWSPEGNLPIKDIADKFRDGEIDRWPVYGVDPDSKEVKLTWCNDVWSSGVKQLIKISFDDGSIIKLTANHVLYKRGKRAVDAYPISAGELSVGDRILATRLWIGGKGHLKHKRYLGMNTKFSNMVNIHQEYSTLLEGKIPTGTDIHHKNDIKTDNREINLIRLSHAEHAALKMFGENNPSNRANKEQRVSRGRKHSESLRRAWAKLSPDDRKRRAKGLPLSIDNHKIVSIEQCEAEETYDFSVPTVHTALVGTGVVAHNCNTQVYFWNCAARLNMTVTCRSNDIIWGAYGANAVHFSMLQEYLAARIGWEVGTYWQVSNNYHAYRSTFEKVRKLEALSADPPYTLGHACPYTIGVVSPFPMVSVERTWDRDLSLFMEDPTSNGYEDPFFHRVAKPLWFAHEAFKVRSDRDRFDKALEILEQCAAGDWKLAARQWILRRRSVPEGA